MTLLDAILAILCGINVVLLWRVVFRQELFRPVITDHDIYVTTDCVISGYKVRLIELNRSNKRNALNTDLLKGLTLAVLEAPNSIVLISGRGSAFSGGLDLRQLYKLKSAEHPLQLLSRLYETLADHPWPTASLVDGQAVAGGVGLAFCADVVVSSPKAVFILPKEEEYRPLAEILIPIIVKRRGIDRKTIKEMYVRDFPAEEAKRLHLVDHVTKDVLMSAAIEILKKKKHKFAPSFDLQVLKEVNRLIAIAVKWSKRPEFRKTVAKQLGLA